jgi:hypothetical protein
MTSEAPRAPTPAVYRVSPLYDIYGQTLYPYVNHKLSGITPYLSHYLLIQAPSRKPSHPSTPSPLSKCPPLIASQSMSSLEKDGGSLM